MFEIVDAFAGKSGTWTHMEFSSDGKDILLTTNFGSLYLIDSYTGQIVHTLTMESSASSNPQLSQTNFMPQTSTPAEMMNLRVQGSISPDSQYIACGSQEDGSISIWNRSTGTLTKRLEGHLSNPCGLVKFNPVYYMLGSTCSNLGFWIPTL